MKLLLLAGTAEARALAGDLAPEPGLRVIASLAGVTERPTAYPCETRIGGFGGPEALARQLRDGGFDALVDATHPFAERITPNAAAAADAAAVPRLRLLRPPWRPRPGDAWRSVPSLAAAAHDVPHGARLFLAVGGGGVGAFAHRADLSLVARGLDPEPPEPAPNLDWISARPASTADAEEALFTRRRIEALVSKNAGGPTDAKLTAARRLGLVVWMVERPVEPDGPRVETVKDAAAWVRDRKAARG